MAGLKWATDVYALKESNNSEQQERNKWQGQNVPRFKMGHGSRWASVVYPQDKSN